MSDEDQEPAFIKQNLLEVCVSSPHRLVRASNSQGRWHSTHSSCFNSSLGGSWSRTLPLSKYLPAGATGSPSLRLRQKGFTDAFLPLIVGSPQRILPSQAEHADVIPNEHDVPHLEVGIEAPSSIGDNQDLHPQEEEDPDGKGDLQEAKAGCDECRGSWTPPATTAVCGQLT